MRPTALRNERGRSAAESMGVLLLVAVIIGGVIASNLDGRIAEAANDMVALISGAGEDDGGSGDNPGGSGNPHGGGNPGGGNAPGGGGSQDDEERRALLCLSSTAEVANCLVAAQAPNAVSEKVNERAREKLMKAQRKLYNTARPGTPEYEKALAARNKALKDLLSSRRITNNFVLRPLAQVRRFVDPRLKDINKGLERMGRSLNSAKGAPLKPNTSSGGPIKATSGSKVLNGLGKLGKGLGIAGTALGLYNNVTKDGVAKGIVETAAGTAAAYGAGIGITAACGAIGVATAGVGGLACAAVAFGGSYLAGKYGTRIGGWAYDRGEAAVDAVNENVLGPVAKVTADAAEGVVEAGSDLVDGGKKVIGALNPFG